MLCNRTPHQPPRTKAGPAPLRTHRRDIASVHYPLRPSPESLCPASCVSYQLLPTWPRPFLHGFCLSRCSFSFTSVSSTLLSTSSPSICSLLSLPCQLHSWIILYTDCSNLLTSHTLPRITPSKVICDLHTAKFKGFFPLLFLVDLWQHLTYRGAHDSFSYLNIYD